MTHSIPFAIDSDVEFDIDQFSCPPDNLLQSYAAETVETWDSSSDLTSFVDYNVDQIRKAKALADAAKQRADFATKVAKGYLANVEYRRGLIEHTVNLAVAQGLVKEAKIKALDYTVNIQDTAGSVQIDEVFNEWREEVEGELSLISQLLLQQVMSGAPIEISEHHITRLANLSTLYLENASPAQYKDSDVLTAKTTLTWDKKFLAQALKNNWLSEKLAGLFKVIKGKALVIRL